MGLLLARLGNVGDFGSTRFKTLSRIHDTGRSRIDSTFGMQYNPRILTEFSMIETNTVLVLNGGNDCMTIAYKEKLL